MKRSKFEHLIEPVHDLPTLPAIAHRLTAVVRDDRSCAADLCGVLKLDAPLAAQILRVANSAYYSAPGFVDSVHRAVVLLGFTCVRNLAMAACVKNLFKPEFRAGAFTARSVWRHSVSVAVIARWIAKRTGWTCPEEAFLAGILHDIGIIVEWHILPQQFAHVVRSWEGTGIPFREAEKRILGFDHCAAGHGVLRRWGMPPALCRVARHHHKTLLDGDDPQPTMIIAVAEQICSRRGDGFFDEPRDDARLEESLERLGFVKDDLPEIVEQVQITLDKSSELLLL